MNKIVGHPKLTPAKLEQIRKLRKTIDREEKDEIIAMGRQIRDRHERIKRVIEGLKSARQAKQLTLDELAKVTGISKPNLSRLENNRVPTPRLDTLLKVADAVGYKLLA